MWKSFLFAAALVTATGAAGRQPPRPAFGDAGLAVGT